MSKKIIVVLSFALLYLSNISFVSATSAIKPIQNIPPNVNFTSTDTNHTNDAQYDDCCKEKKKPGSDEKQ